MKRLRFKKHKSRDNVGRILSATTFSLVSLTLLLGLVLSSSASSALVGNSEQSNVSVTVPNSCTMSGDVITPHTDTIANGTKHEGIGTTKMKIFCNDSNGYRVYAIGASNDENGNTNMISSLGSNNIATGSSITGTTSSWSMLLTAGTGSGATTTPPTIASGFNAYHDIPNQYTIVATRPSATDMGSDVDVSGSYFTTTYRVYVGSTQPAATYTGKVKYAVLHPSTGEDTLKTLQDALADAHAPTTTGTDGKTYYALHGLDADVCASASITGTNSTTKLADARDGEIYTVAKLADNKCWLLDNLRLDPTNSTTASKMNSTNTHATTEAISNYLNGGSTGNPGWSTAAVADVDTDFRSYTEPRINNASIDTEVTSYGPAANNGKAKTGVYYNYCAATVGTYCYDSASTRVDATFDICPTNWRMPTGGTNGEYRSLCTALFGSECTNPTSMNATNANSLQYNLSTPLSGNYSTDHIGGQNYNGYFWSTTQDNPVRMFSLYTDPNIIWSFNTNDRYFGFSVRCVVDMDKSMQNVDSWGSSLAVGEEVKTVDERDGNEYTVARLCTNYSGNDCAESQLWMTQNLDLDIGSTGVLDSTNTDLNVDLGTAAGYFTDSTTGKITWNPNVTKSNITSWNEGDNPGAVPNWYDDSVAPYQSESNDNYVYGINRTIYNSLSLCEADNHTEAECVHYKVGNYYNWSAAVASNNTNNYTTQYTVADNSICPKGWRLPKGLTNPGGVVAQSEFNKLLSAQNIAVGTDLTGGMNVNYTTNGYEQIKTISANGSPLYFVSSGYIGNKSLYIFSSEGRYWCSSILPNTSGAYILSFGGFSLYPSDKSGRGYGRSVRCVSDY